MPLAPLAALLQTALTLYTLSATPALPPAMQERAKTLAEQAISYAANTLNEQAVPYEKPSCTYVSAVENLARTAAGVASKDACAIACRHLHADIFGASDHGQCMWIEAVGSETLSYY